MDTYRTSDERFLDLPDFPWPPSSAEVHDGDGGTLRMAYVDAGPADGPVALLLHGEPSWSFLYRQVIAVLTDAGHPRAWRPTWSASAGRTSRSRREDHTYARHVEWMRELVLDHLDLREVTLVGQDWGGLIGLRLVAEHPDRFARVVAANTGLPTGDFDMPEIWWRSAARSRRPRCSTSAGWSPPAACARCADEVRAAYDAPFPEEANKAGARAMPDAGADPRPTTPPPRPTAPPGRCSGVGAAVPHRLQRLRPDHRGMAPILQQHVPGAHGLDHPTITNAGHFLQEDAGDELGGVVERFMSPASS